MKNVNFCSAFNPGLYKWIYLTGLRREVFISYKCCGYNGEQGTSMGNREVKMGTKQRMGNDRARVQFRLCSHFSFSRPVLVTSLQISTSNDLVIHKIQNASMYCCFHL